MTLTPPPKDEGRVIATIAVIAFLIAALLLFIGIAEWLR